MEVIFNFITQYFMKVRNIIMVNPISSVFIFILFIYIWRRKLSFKREVANLNSTYKQEKEKLESNHSTLIKELYSNKQRETKDLKMLHEDFIQQLNSKNEKSIRGLMDEKKELKLIRNKEIENMNNLLQSTERKLKSKCTDCNYENKDLSESLTSRALREIKESFDKEEIYIYNNITIPNPANFGKKRRQIDHLLICNKGILVIETKSWRGDTFLGYGLKPYPEDIFNKNNAMLNYIGCKVLFNKLNAINFIKYSDNREPFVSIASDPFNQAISAGMALKKLTSTYTCEQVFSLVNFFLPENSSVQVNEIYLKTKAYAEFSDDKHKLLPNFKNKVNEFIKGQLFPSQKDINFNAKRFKEYFESDFLNISRCNPNVCTLKDKNL